MRPILVSFVLLFPLAAHAQDPVIESSSPIPGATKQLLIVRSASWRAHDGTLERFVLGDDDQWVSVESAIPVALGRTGMAWGRGIQQRGLAGPIKREGDGKSPAGVFALRQAFGTDASLLDGAHHFPYLHATSTNYCVEDTRSAHYNQLIDSGNVTTTLWEKWSPLRRSDGLFDWGIVVEQNSSPTVPGAGSCVFLHIWRGRHSSTAGCTAMARNDIEDVLRWLDPSTNPLLVQLPQRTYDEQRRAWTLP